MPIAALAGLVWGPNVLQLIPEIGSPEKVHIAVRRLLSFILIIMRCVVLGFAFWELSVAPRAAYEQVSWASYIPHI
ncbi:hypothetical protein FRC12_016220 [Ceratobasidium sp. 428]|nr:hypothetical protein FRC12_016220 [Ceratobasidium sp. 428]